MSTKALTHLSWDSDFFSRDIFHYVPQTNCLLDCAAIPKNSLIQSKISSADISSIDALQAQNFVLVESDCLFTKDLTLQAADRSGYQNSAAINTQEVAALASEIFLNSRFRTPWFSQTQTASFYQKWAINAINQSFDDICLVEIIEGRLAGFVTARMQENHQAVIGLIGTHSRYRGQGVAKKLLQRIESWAMAQGALTLLVATQGSNEKAMQCYTKQRYNFTSLSFWFYKQL